MSVRTISQIFVIAEFYGLHTSDVIIERVVPKNGPLVKEVVCVFRKEEQSKSPYLRLSVVPLRILV